VLGFTERQWPFIFVLIGNWLFAALFFGLCKLFWHRVPTEWPLGDRIALVIKDAVIAILPAVLAICIVAAQRLDPSMFVGRMPKPNSAVDINNASFSTRSSNSSSISSAMRGSHSIAHPKRRAR